MLVAFFFHGLDLPRSIIALFSRSSAASDSEQNLARISHSHLLCSPRPEKAQSVCLASVRLYVSLSRIFPNVEVHNAYTQSDSPEGSRQRMS